MGNQLQVQARIPRVDKRVARALGLRTSSKKSLNDQKLSKTNSTGSMKKTIFRTGSTSSILTSSTTLSEDSAIDANTHIVKNYDAPTSISLCLQETVWENNKPKTTVEITISGDAMNGGKVAFNERVYRLNPDQIHVIEQLLVDMGCRDKKVDLRGRPDSSKAQGTVTISTKMTMPGMHSFVQYDYDEEGLPATSSYKTSKRCIKYNYDFWLKSSGYEGKSGPALQSLLQFLQELFGEHNMYHLLNKGFRDFDDFDSDSDSDDE